MALQLGTRRRVSAEINEAQDTCKMFRVVRSRGTVGSTQKTFFAAGDPHLPALSEHRLPKNRDRLSQTLPLKRFQIFGHRLGRVLQALTMIFRRCHHSPRSQVEEVKDEFVRVLRFNTEWSEYIGRKVAKVHP